MRASSKLNNWMKKKFLFGRCLISNLCAKDAPLSEEFFISVHSKFRQLKVENVTVNFGSLRTAIDGMVQDTQDALVSTLRKSLLVDVDAISGFISNANAVLSSQPTTTEELAALSGDFHRLVRESEQVEAIITRINQSITQSINQSINQSQIDAWINREIKKSIQRNQSIAKVDE